MGKKGDKLTTRSLEAAAHMVEQLIAIEGITTKRMFGGYGIFHDARMFGMVSSKGEYFLKVDATKAQEFEDTGSHKHSRMPYYSIPQSVLDQNNVLVDWALGAIENSKNTSK